MYLSSKINSKLYKPFPAAIRIIACIEIPTAPRNPGKTPHKPPHKIQLVIIEVPLPNLNPHGSIRVILIDPFKRNPRPQK